MKKLTLSLLALGSAMLLSAGFLDKPVESAAYVPNDATLVGFVDSGRLLNHPKIQSVFALVKNEMGADLMEELNASLAQNNLKIADIAGKFYFFALPAVAVADIEEVAVAENGDAMDAEALNAELSKRSFAVLIMTEGDTAQRLFQQEIDEAKAQKKEISTAEIAGFQAITQDSGSAVLLTPNAAIFFNEFEPAQVETILKGTGTNPLMTDLVSGATILAVRGNPDAGMEETQGMEAINVTLNDENNDMTFQAKLVTDSPETAAATLAQINENLMNRLQMMVMFNPEKLTPLIAQISVKAEKNDVIVNVPQVGELVNNLMSSLVQAMKIQQQMMQQQQMMPPTK